MDGVLIMNKPSGWTSHDVVQKARGLLRERRIGHTGTLDPSATGVLVLCIGKATRIAHYLEAQEKEYRARMRLGVITDTLDADGTVVETRSYERPSREELQAILRDFTGTIDQRPPAFSALKVNGVPAYRLARQGKPVDLRIRQVQVHRLDLLAYDDPFVELEIVCSKGLYVRSLCADIGERVGSGAHLAGLVRTRSGRFLIKDALTMEELEYRTRRGDIANALISLDNALSEYPSVEIGPDDARRVRHGNAVDWPGGPEQPELVRVHEKGKGLIALGKAAEGRLRPELVFQASGQ